jgi:hypothetical protein
MTKHTVTVDNNRSVRSVIFENGKGISLDTLINRDEMSNAYVNLTNAEAHAFADWIKENVPVPPVQTAREFILEQTPGTMIRIPRTGSEFVILNGHRVLRTKIGPRAEFMNPHINNVGDSWPITHYGFDRPNDYEVMK